MAYDSSLIVCQQCHEERVIIPSQKHHSEIIEELKEKYENKKWVRFIFALNQLKLIFFKLKNI